MPKEKELALSEEKQIIEDYITASNDSEVEELLSKYNLSNRRLNGILRSNSGLMQEIFTTKCSLDVYRENKFISEIKEKSFAYLLDQIQCALESENSLAYLDKITKMVETVDKIDRLNRNQATENIQTTNTSTTTTVNVSDLISQLSSPEDKKNFLLKKMEDLRFSNNK
jgi:hypothetical protein